MDESSTLESFVKNPDWTQSLLHQENQDRSRNDALGLSHVHGGGVGASRKGFIARYCSTRTPVYMDVLKTGVCVFGLRETHPALLEAQKDNHIHAKYIDSCTSMKVTGKRKRGSVQLKQGDTLCTLNVGKEEFLIGCPLNAQVVEINENLITDASRLSKSPGNTGYLAILLPKGFRKIESILEKNEEFHPGNC